MGFDDDLSYFIESTPTNAATVPLERSGPSTSGSLNSQPTATVSCPDLAVMTTDSGRRNYQGLRKLTRIWIGN